MDSGAEAQQIDGQGRAGGHQMLAVVQDQQEMPSFQRVHERAPHRLPRLLLDAQHVGDRLGDKRGIGKRSQLDEPKAVPIEQGGGGYVPFENFVGRAELIFFSIREDTPIWEFWRWPWDVRWNRLFTLIR